MQSLKQSVIRFEAKKHNTPYILKPSTNCFLFTTMLCIASVGYEFNTFNTHISSKQCPKTKLAQNNNLYLPKRIEFIRIKQKNCLPW